MDSKTLPPGIKIELDSNASLFDTGKGVLAKGVLHLSPATAFRFYMGEDISVLDLSQFERDMLDPLPMTTMFEAPKRRQG